MPHEIAKLLLEKAGTFIDRVEAVRAAQKLGMPLREIEEYLDWLEMLREQLDEDHPRGDRPGGPADSK